MGTLTASLCQFLEARREALVKAVVRRLADGRPVPDAPTPDAVERHESVHELVRHLAQAVAAESPALFADHVAWARTRMGGLGIPAEEVRQQLYALEAVLQHHEAPEAPGAVRPYLEAGLAALRTPAAEPPSLTEGNDRGPLGPLLDVYLTALLEGRKHDASRAVLEAVEAGTSVTDVYLHVFQRSQRELGRLWQLNRLSIAQEHYCTAATQFIMSQLYPYIFRTEKDGRRFVATCVGGDLHEIGLRMVADLLELNGWDTHYLGADVPAGQVLDALDERGCDLLGVSVTMPYHLDATRALIEAVRAGRDDDTLRIMVGGYPFNLDPKLWRWVGADGHAPDALEALRVSDALVPPPTRAARSASDAAHSA